VDGGLRFVGFLVGLAVALAVYSDAAELKKHGAKVAPGLWAVAAFLLWLLVLPLYLILRVTSWRRQIDAAKGLPPRPLTTAQVVSVTALAGVLLLGVLSAVVALMWLWGLWKS
jgi:hypothetical protein